MAQFTSGIESFRTCTGLLLLLGILIPAGMGQGSSTIRASVASDGTQSTGYSSFASISAEGRYIAFGSAATNLTHNDLNGAMDIFLHDCVNGQTWMQSLADTGSQGNAESYWPSVSANGLRVAFSTNATDLVPGDTNGTWDILVRDNTTQKTARVSVSSGGAQANGASSYPFISSDGRYIVFESSASNLVSSDSNSATDVFLHDIQTHQTTRVSLSSTGAQSNSSCNGATISLDGRYIAFYSLATNLVPGDTNGHRDVFVRDRFAGTTTRVSVDSNGLQGNGDSTWGHISGDGRFVIFSSEATNLVVGDTNGHRDVFVHDQRTGNLTRVSTDSSGLQGNGSSTNGHISFDGRYMCFESEATNLASGDSNGYYDTYLKDRLTGKTTLVSVSTAGAQSGQDSWWSVISADGSLVSLTCEGPLAPGDTNGLLDIYFHDNAGCSSTLATYCVASSTSIPGCQAAISAVGTPSLSSPMEFVISSGAVPGGANFAIAYYGVSGPANVLIGSQGGYLCVAQPFRRTLPQPSGGTPGACDGQYEFTLQDLVDEGAGIIVPGSTVHAAIWFRDPQSPDHFALSDGLWFSVCP